MKVGVAISVYNKSDFVMTNAAVLKKHWKVSPYLAVCCNDSSTWKKLVAVDEIDEVVRGDDIEVVNINNPSCPRRKASLRKRQHDCIRKSVSAAAKGSDYVIHWHADAFALSDSTVHSLVNEMQQKNISFAARGLWKRWKSSKTPSGDIDDHFFVIRSDFVRESKIFAEESWDKVCSMIKRGVCSEGIVSSLVTETLPEEEIMIYSDMSECEVPLHQASDSRYADKLPHRTLPPINIDPKRKFVHCDIYDQLPVIFQRFGVPIDLIR